MTEELPTRSSTRKRKATKYADFVYFDGKNNENIENVAVVEQPAHTFLYNLKEMDAPDIISAHLESLERRMDLITNNYNCLIDTNQSLSFQKSQFLGNSSFKNYKYSESDEVAIGTVMEKILRVISHFHKTKNISSLAMATPTRSTLGSFYLRETGEIRNVYLKYLFSEMPVHVFNIFIIFFTFYFIFSKKVLIHTNLKIVITSYSLTSIFLSIFRLTWLICDVFWVPLSIMEFFMFGRFIFQTSISAHLFVLSTERVIATVNSNNYEHNSCSFIIVFWCLMTYPYSGVLLYSKYCIENGRQLNIFTTIICSGGSLIAMLVVYFVNKKRVDARRWKSKVSEAYSEKKLRMCDNRNTSV